MPIERQNNYSPFLVGSRRYHIPLWLLRRIWLYLGNGSLGVSGRDQLLGNASKGLSCGDGN
jgi:hypothetical protein